MDFHVFGNADNKALMLLHGVLTPWQIWQRQAEYFSRDYRVIVPALDGHTSEPSRFISVEAEAKKICAYVKEKLGGRIYALCGLSMGGAIVNAVLKSGKIAVDRAVFDGAPLVPMAPITIKLMTMSYIDIIHKSKQRDKKTLENFSKTFLPEEYLEYYLHFADVMSDASITNMVESSGNCQLIEDFTGVDTKFFFMHGTKSNEVYAKKSAELLKKRCPTAKVTVFDGYAHGEAAIYHADEWIRTVEGFLK